VDNAGPDDGGRRRDGADQHFHWGFFIHSRGHPNSEWINGKSEGLKIGSESRSALTDTLLQSESSDVSLAQKYILMPDTLWFGIKNRACRGPVMIVRLWTGVRVAMGLGEARLRSGGRFHPMPPVPRSP
jgi:hypothetical protein